MNKLELEELMLRISSGRDEMAFSTLFDFLAPKINAYFIQNGLLPDNSEELTQEVLSTVWAKSHQYDASKAAVSTWVYTIARNKKVDFFRKKSTNSYNEQDIREFLYNEGNGDVLAKNEINDQVDKIKNELNKTQQRIIRMNFFENKSHKKIAEELEIPLGTVKSRIRHILVKMQSIL